MSLTYELGRLQKADYSPECGGHHSIRPQWEKKTDLPLSKWGLN
jgi:hypothetical protein